MTKHPDIERGQYTDDDGVVWRIMQEWGEAVFGLEYRRDDGTWQCVTEVGDPDDDEDPAEYVRANVRLHKQFCRLTRVSPHRPHTRSLPCDN